MELNGEPPADFAMRLLRSRRSMRAFLPEPLPAPLLTAIFAAAGQAPSNCNTQPWRVEVVSGETRGRLSSALVRAGKDGRFTPDFPFDESRYEGALSERRKEQGRLWYGAMGIARDDAQAREAAIVANLNFFGAPHAAFLFMPSYMAERIAADVGMYAQMLMLAMAAHGVASCPQTVLGYFAETVRQELDIDATSRLLFGISFGYPDMNARANSVVMPRAALSETTRFHF